VLRGQVVGDDARAWTAGLLVAGDYFARARRQALIAASAAVRRRLRQRQQAVTPEGSGTSP
jgi:hypothetical protein